MGAVILIAVLAVVVLAVATVLVFLQLQKVKADRQNRRYSEYLQRQQRAAYATAVVVSAQGGVPSDGAEQVLMELTLEVTPPGSETYRAHTRWIVGVTALGNLQTGSNIQVKIDADDPKIIYPGSTWARFTPPD